MGPVPSPVLALIPMLIGWSVRYFGNRSLHGINVHGHFWPLREDHTIHVGNFHSMVPQSSDRFMQKVGTIAISVFLSIVWEQSSNILLRDRTEDGIGHRVQQDISITVTDAMYLAIDVDAPDAKWTAVAKSVGVVSKSHSDRWNGCCHGSFSVQLNLNLIRLVSTRAVSHSAIHHRLVLAHVIFLHSAVP